MKKIKSAKKSKRLISKKFKGKIIILEHKKRFEEVKEKKPEKIDLENEEEDEDFEFSPGFRSASSTKRSLENLPVGSSLESGLAFAPRIKEKGKEGKNYSETKYETNYVGSKYGEKTPDEYANVEPLPAPSEDSSNQ